MRHNPDVRKVSRDKSALYVCVTVIPIEFLRANSAEPCASENLLICLGLWVFDFGLVPDFRQKHGEDTKQAKNDEEYRQERGSGLGGMVRS